MSILSDCARELLEVAPMVVNAIRADLRDRNPCGLTITQFRALAYIDLHQDSSLSDLAHYLGLQLPSASRLVDGLVADELVTRQLRQSDRRCVTLAVTASGHSLRLAALDAAGKYLELRLACLPQEEQAEIAQSLHRLRPLFNASANPISPAPEPG